MDKEDVKELLLVMSRISETLSALCRILVVGKLKEGGDLSNEAIGGFLHALERVDQAAKGEVKKVKHGKVR